MRPRCSGTSVSVSAGHGTVPHQPARSLGFEIPPPVGCGTWQLYRGGLLGVQPLPNPQSGSAAEEPGCFVWAGVLPRGKERSCSNWWAPLCRKHVSGLCLINLQIIDSSVTVSLSSVDSAEERVHASLLL